MTFSGSSTGMPTENINKYINWYYFIEYCKL
jgi:hypothetical protein